MHFILKSEVVLEKRIGIHNIRRRTSKGHLPECVVFGWNHMVRYDFFVDWVVVVELHKGIWETVWGL